MVGGSKRGGRVFGSAFDGICSGFCPCTLHQIGYQIKRDQKRQKCASDNGSPNFVLPDCQAIHESSEWVVIPLTCLQPLSSLSPRTSSPPPISSSTLQIPSILNYLPFRTHQQVILFAPIAYLPTCLPTYHPISFPGNQSRGTFQITSRRVRPLGIQVSSHPSKMLQGFLLFVCLLAWSPFSAPFFPPKISSKFYFFWVLKIWNAENR